MSFDPNRLSPNERVVYALVMSDDATINLEQWIGSAFSAIRSLSGHGEPWTDAQRDAAFEILFRKAPERVVQLGDRYDNGQL